MVYIYEDPDTGKRNLVRGYDACSICEFPYPDHTDAWKAHPDGAKYCRRCWNVYQRWRRKMLRRPDAYKWDVSVPRFREQWTAGHLINDGYDPPVGPDHSWIQPEAAEPAWVTRARELTAEVRRRTEGQGRLRLKAPKK